MFKKNILIILTLLSILLLSSCRGPRGTEFDASAAHVSSNPAPAASTAPETATVNLGCSVNADCTAGNLCIDGTCKTLASLYQNDCTNQCNYNAVVLKTSDGDTYTLNKGQGSYTAAGALEWQLLTIPDYCPEEKVTIPLKIIQKNAGKVLGEQIVTVKEGATSAVITHPTIKRISFTITVEIMEETCS